MTDWFSLLPFHIFYLFQFPSVMIDQMGFWCEFFIQFIDYPIYLFKILLYAGESESNL